jgi:pantothenate kinase
MPETLANPTLGSLVARARALAAAEPAALRLLGIAGPPGAGKTTLATALVDALGPGLAVLVPMDGFHLANEDLVVMGLRDRKGAPETFDAIGYAALLARLRDVGDAVTYAPDFDRTADSVVPDAIAVTRGVPLVVTEGNYLLLDDDGWTAVRPLLDEAWYVAGDDARVERLIARHVAHGKSPAHARDWVLRSDEANARVIEATRDRADLVIEGLPVA